jgi:hypothetical protein
MQISHTVAPRVAAGSGPEAGIKDRIPNHSNVKVRAAGIAVKQDLVLSSEARNVVHCQPALLRLAQHVCRVKSCG